MNETATAPPPAAKPRAWLRWTLPLAIFAVLVAFLFVGLGRNPSEVPSPLVGKPAPAFRLADLHQAGRVVTVDDFKGQVWLLNVWASWCVACRIEHPLLVELAKAKVVPIVGLNYKDNLDDGRAWLVRHGDPYTLSAVDADGRAGIDWGVYGVPETFVIDRQGIIRHKHIGPLDRQALEKTLLPLVQKLKAS